MSLSARRSRDLLAHWLFDIAGIRINSFTATVAFIGALIYFFGARKAREDHAAVNSSGGDERASDTAMSADGTAAWLNSSTHAAAAAADDSGPTHGLLLRRGFVAVVGVKSPHRGSA